MYDYEAARKVWEAQVPVELRFGGPEVRPLYMMLPRCSYFCIHLAKIVQHFASRDDAEVLTMDTVYLWLENHKQPLKTYYPVGVLYDLYKPRDADIWTITVKSGVRPKGVHLVQKDDMESMFMQSVKEADYLKRKAEVISSMKTEDHHQLWNGVAQYSFDLFWEVNKRLMESSDDNPFIHVPLRVYEEGKAFKQVPVKPLNESGDAVTLLDALSSLCPHLDAARYQFVTHGIALPLETPVSYLAASLSYPDNFVHISAVPL